MKARHNKVDFNPGEWMAETARMSRLVKSVFFDICLFNWERARAMPEPELMMTLQDIGGEGPEIVSLLMQTGKVTYDDVSGGYYVGAALEAGMRAADIFERKSGGGKKGAAKTNAAETDAGLTAALPEPPKVSPNDIYSNPHPNPDLGAIAPLSVSSETDQTKQAPAAAEPEPDLEETPDEAAKAAERLRIAAEKLEKRKADVAAVVTAWNAMAVTAKLARIAKLTDERRKKIGARLDENTVDDLVEAINLIPQRPFCMGHNDRNWKADIDFLLRPNTVTKIREGTAYMGRSDDAGWASA